MKDTLQSLFNTWKQLTLQEIRYQPCERMLYDFHQNGFTEDDMRCVLTFMLWSNRKREPQYRDRILFHRIIGDIETFNSRLGEARAWERNRKRPLSGKDEIMSATGRLQPEEPKTRHISEVFKSIK